METEFRQGDESQKSEEIKPASIARHFELERGDWVEHKCYGKMEVDSVYTEDGRKWVLCKCWTTKSTRMYIHFLSSSLEMIGRPITYFPSNKWQ
jgi:hypothetical protein